MHDTTGLDERPVEQDLREILEPLDRQLARAIMLIPLALVTVVPSTFFTLWLYYDWYGRRALITAAGACCAIAFCYMCWEILASRLARWRFNRRFPPGTSSRALALRILAEMETPTRAEEKLRGALACSSGDRIIRRRAATPAAEPVLPPPLLPPVQLQTGSSPTPRPGGYYDYIPLEPRQGDDPRRPPDPRG